MRPADKAAPDKWDGNQGENLDAACTTQEAPSAVPPTVPMRPTYAAAFRCIGPACEDTCCRGWNIPVDKATYHRYAQFPQDPLGAVVAEFVTITPPPSPDTLYAVIHQTPSGSCAFFTPDRLCGIQQQYGPELLSATCSIYPRSLNLVEGQLEGVLSLSCPEAARNVLLTPDATEVQANLFSGEFRTDNVSHLGTNTGSSIPKPYYYFQSVRALLVAMIKDRNRPIWQRLLLIGSLCQRLHAIATTEQEDNVPAILDEYHQVLANNWLHNELNSMPKLPRLKLSVILALTNDRVRDKSSGSRFQDTFWTFIEGIGSSPDIPGDDIDRYLHAEENYHGPIFAKSPHILENYLLNYLYQHLFPFGYQGTRYSMPHSIFDEYILIATQFAWVNALLIGISGHHKESFGDEHVVHAVQSFSRAVEHYPYVREALLDTIKQQKLDTLQGMAVLLR